MFEGLTRKSSRIAIAAAFGLLLGGFAMKATPAQAADLGGDCCADLEERVAELEATTVRKGNKKVSVTLSGWVVKSLNWWDDGSIDHAVVGDKDYDLGTRFAITGSAQIAPGWSGGFNITVNTWANCFGTLSNQFDDLAGCVGTDSVGELLGGFGNNYGGIATLYSYIYLKSDTLGALNWGHLSPASDNAAVLADISGTVIETNAVWFEGPAFGLRPKGSGAGGLAGLSAFTWGDFLRCQGLGANIGADCWGVAQPAVRYDSPTWGGFRFEASYGKNQLIGPLQTGIYEAPFGGAFGFVDREIDTSDTDFADIAVFYTGDWNSIKLSAAASYTWVETSAWSALNNSFDRFSEFGETDLFQIGASIMHKPSGLGIYGLYQHESTDSRVLNLELGGGNPFFPFGQVKNLNNFSMPDSDVWYVKPFWRKAWSPIGATVLYGEYGEYNDQFAPLVGLDLASFGGGLVPNTNCTDGSSACFVTGSEVQRWGLGVVQEIDSAAMHLWARWQHQEIDVDITGWSQFFGVCHSNFDPDLKSCKVKQGFDDWDLFQVGGIIFF